MNVEPLISIAPTLSFTRLLCCPIPRTAALSGQSQKRTLIKAIIVTQPARWIRLQPVLGRFPSQCPLVLSRVTVSACFRALVVSARSLKVIYSTTRITRAIYFLMKMLILEYSFRVIYIIMHIIATIISFRAGGLE